MAKNALPPHFASLSLRNFRGFKIADDIPLAPLTFLVGPNSSGKSSIFDSLMLLAQSSFTPAYEGSIIPTWIGPLVDLGSFKDTAYRHRTNLKITIAVQISSNVAKFRPWARRPFLPPSPPIRVEYQLQTVGKDAIGFLSAVRVTDVTSKKNIIIRYARRGGKLRAHVHLPGQHRVVPAQEMEFRGHLTRWCARQIGKFLKANRSKDRGSTSGWNRLRNFLGSYSYTAFVEGTQRVASGRGGPKRWYPLSSRDIAEFYGGRRLFEAVDPPMIEDSKRSEHGRATRRERASRINSLVSALRQLNIGSDVTGSKLSAYHSVIEVKDNITGVRSNLIDVGYGASQVIPVIGACLSDIPGPLFVEQPEIHLHPKAQGNVAELLCLTSLQRQVIVETHSAHMINRARILVAQGRLDPKNVVINFVSRDRSGSHVHTIPINKSGDFLAPWPEGFFDERYEDTMTLLQLK